MLSENVSLINNTTHSWCSRNERARKYAMQIAEKTYVQYMTLSCISMSHSLIIDVCYYTKVARLGKMIRYTLVSSVNSVLLMIGGKILVLIRNKLKVKCSSEPYTILCLIAMVLISKILL